MTANRPDLAEALEFVHATCAGDVDDARRLVEAPHHQCAGLEAGGGAGGGGDGHVFLLRHGGSAVAALWLREHAGGRDPSAWVISRFVTSPRQGPGCSYRLLMIVWSAQWMLTHAAARTLTATCRTDALHRYRPLGFETAGGWCRGADGNAVVAISADVREIARTGCWLGLDAVLDTALLESCAVA